jgi:hypothetical protein
LLREAPWSIIGAGSLTWGGKMRLFAQHDRLLLATLALLISGLSLAIWTSSSVVTFYGPGPGTYRWAGLDLSAWVPAVGWVLGFILLAAALVRRGSVRIWAGILALFLAFSMGFAYWGLPSFYGEKTPTNCCPTLQH